MSSVFTEKSPAERTISYLRREIEEFAVFIAPVLWLESTCEWVDIVRRANTYLSASEGSPREFDEIVDAMPSVTRELVKIHLPNEKFGKPVLKTCWPNVNRLFHAAANVTALVDAIEPDDVKECTPILQAIDDYSRALGLLKERMAEQPYAVLVNPAPQSLVGVEDDFEW